ncbi:MAG: PAS domain-containing sensor histidine kinase [Burkholderiales bacterium]
MIVQYQWLIIGAFIIIAAQAVLIGCLLFQRARRRRVDTERKKHDETLTQERAFLRQVIEIDPNLIFAKDRQGRFTLANRALADIYGTTVEGLIGKSDADFNSNVEEVEAFRRADIDVMNTLQERVIPEERITDATGKIHYLQTVKRPIVGADGTARQILGTATDITARRLAEQSIRASEDFNRTVLASLQDHIAILDANGTIVAVNDAWTQFALRNGVPPTMAGSGVGVSYLEVCRHAAASGDESAGRAQDGISRVLEGDSSSFVMEYRCDAPSESRWFLLRVLPFRRAEGGVVVSHSNITQRKEAELELGRQRNELAHFARVTMLGELSGSLAHELNQPLAAILSNAQAALRFLTDDDYDRNEVREILRDIVNADKRAGEVIRGLRLLLKKGEMRQEPLDLNEVVRDVLGLMRSDILNARVDLTAELAPNLPMLTGDRVQLEQVLLNLLMNGCDAMADAPASGRKLLVTTRHIATDSVVVSVTDRGPGIPPEDLERVFEPFYSTKAQGLGLGLMVSRKIIGAHGGRLYAENNAGGGASFCFTLPANPEAIA